MPLSLQEVLDHADELARRFEQHEPDPRQFRDGHPLAAISQAVQARAQAEKDIVAAVADARRAGHPWWLIGSMLGTSGEAARQRYAKLISR